MTAGSLSTFAGSGSSHPLGAPRATFFEGGSNRAALLSLTGPGITARAVPDARAGTNRRSVARVLVVRQFNSQENTRE
jgi:hypothetical protein